MSSIKVYHRKPSNNIGEFGSKIEEEKEVHNNWIPETPSKPTPPKLQFVYSKGCLKRNSSVHSNVARISEQEPRNSNTDKNSEVIKDQKSQIIDCSLSASGLIDLNISIDDCDSKDFADSENGFPEAATEQVTTDHTVCSVVNNDSGDSGEELDWEASEQVTTDHTGKSPVCSVVNNSSGSSGDLEEELDWEGTFNRFGDAKACCSHNVARSLDFWNSAELNKGFDDDLDATLDTIPSTELSVFQEFTAEIIQSEANWSSSQESSTSFQVLATPELDRQRPENHNILFSCDLENVTNKNHPESNITQRDKEKDLQGGEFVSSVENEKLHCFEPSTPSLKHNVSKRPRNGTDVNQRPLKKSKIKIKKRRHRPKIAGQGRPKRAVKTPKEKKEKRKYVRKNQSEKKGSKNNIRKTDSEKKGKVNSQQSSTKEHHTDTVAASLLSVGKQPSDDNPMGTLQTEVAITREQATMAEVAITGEQATMAEVAITGEQATMAEVAITGEQASTASNYNITEIKSTMQSGMSKNIGVQNLLANLDSDKYPVRWRAYGTRSVGDYYRNSQMVKSSCCHLYKIGCHCVGLQRKKFKVGHIYKVVGCHCVSSWGVQRKFRVDHCLSNSRKIEPVFPKMCKRRRIKRQRKSNVSIILSFLHLHIRARKIRSKRLSQRGNLASIDEIPTSNHMPIIPLNQNFDDLNQTCEEFQKALLEDSQKALLERKGMEEGSASNSPEEGSASNSPEEGLASNSPEELASNPLEEQLLINEEREEEWSPIEKEIPGPRKACNRKGQPKSCNENAVSRRPKYKTVETLTKKFQLLKISDIDTTSAIVPYKAPNSTKKPRKIYVSTKKHHEGSDSTEKTSKPKMEIVLDSESLRRWDQLFITDCAGEEKVDQEQEKMWEEDTKILHGRIGSFTSKMHLILGDRRFKPWKGSVVDSIVGVFLTQNVSDFLSSNAYMSLAAKFPAQSTSNQEASNVDLENMNSQESIESNIPCIETTLDSYGNAYFVTEPRDMVEARSSVDIEDCIGNRILQLEHYSHESKLVRYENFENASGLNLAVDVIKNKMLDLSPAILKKATKGKEGKVEKRDWDSLRRQYSRSQTRDHADSVDWEAVRRAPVTEIAETIKERGQHNVLAKGIQNCLNRIVTYHGSIDLEWLRYAPPDIVKEYLLEIPGIGLKSVECLRLLTLHNIAFPVDTNVARIAVRLGWVPLQPLPGDLQFHLLEEYPMMDQIQKYLWPKLCSLDQRTLYELHYQMITFGKVFCSKRRPSCGACPMRAECRHFASAVASENLSLPGPSKKVEERSIVPSTPVVKSTMAGNYVAVVANPILVSHLESSETLESGFETQHCEPIIEEPKSPEPQSPELAQDIEDFEVFDDEKEEIPTIKLNNEPFKENVQYYLDKYWIQAGHSSRALVPANIDVDSVPLRKLKHTSNNLRTEHQVYELPDSHELLRGRQIRESDDSTPYLLAIWTPGETPDSSMPPEKRCNSQGSELCNDQTCFTCQTILEERAGIVRGTILIPCRTAMRARFPLNGTYFQVNEVFADHESSYKPILVYRNSLRELSRKTVYTGTSVTAIFRKDISTREIQLNFWRGFICVRGFDRKTGAPRPLSKRFHCSPSKMEKTPKRANQNSKDNAKSTEHIP